jgi:hypothetical protein
MVGRKSRRADGLLFRKRSDRAGFEPLSSGRALRHRFHESDVGLTRVLDRGAIPELRLKSGEISLVKIQSIGAPRWSAHDRLPSARSIPVRSRSRRPFRKPPSLRSRPFHGDHTDIVVEALMGRETAHIAHNCRQKLFQGKRGKPVQARQEGGFAEFFAFR